MFRRKRLHISAKPRRASSGFTLMELIVVMIIVGILATGTVMMFSNATAKARGVIFSLQGDLNLARAEAVERNRDVLVDFTLGSRDGYQLCLDTDADNDCSNEAAADIIKEVLIEEEVQFYDCAAAPPYPVEGPHKTPSGTDLAGKGGIIFGGPTYVRMQPDGTSSDNGSIIVYCPDPGNPLQVRGNPYAVVISSAGTGRIRVMRWRKDIGWSRR